MNSNKDISGIIRDWEYQPGQTSARKIRGKDGKEKIQMRVELGLLQMETQGRPDVRDLTERYPSWITIFQDWTNTERSMALPRVSN